jgi:prepilin-type N-terminal cleavage/methylation domain-containing protein
MKLCHTTSFRNEGFTLAEVVITTAIGAIVIGGSIYGYITAAQRAEWAAYSLAAHSLAMQRVEQSRAAKWDLLGFPPVDELVATNFPEQVNMLDIPVSKTNIVYATNFTTITTVTANPLLKMIRVDCCWSFMNRGPFTNTVVTYRAPDQ